MMTLMMYRWLVRHPEIKILKIHLKDVIKEMFFTFDEYNEWLNKKKADIRKECLRNNEFSIFGI